VSPHSLASTNPDCMPPPGLHFGFFPGKEGALGSTIRGEGSVNRSQSGAASRVRVQGTDRNLKQHLWVRIQRLGNSAAVSRVMEQGTGALGSSVFHYEADQACSIMTQLVHCLFRLEQQRPGPHDQSGNHQSDPPNSISQLCSNTSATCYIALQIASLRSLSCYILSQLQTLLPTNPCT